MMKFILMLIVIIALVGGAYYYFSVQPAHEVVQQEVKAAQDAQAKKIPDGVMMEDGTIGE